jgi:hypothetical protein
MTGGERSKGLYGDSGPGLAGRTKSLVAGRAKGRHFLIEI